MKPTPNPCRSARPPAGRLLLVLALGGGAGVVGCTGPAGPPTGPMAGGSPVPPADAAVPALRPISYVRRYVIRGDDELRMTIAADGSYRISRRGGGGPSSSKVGVLTPDQRRKLAAAFAGWDALDDVYPDPGGADEVYRVTIGYGDKSVQASDAALKLPQTFRDAYRQLRAVVSEAGMV